MNRAVAAEWLKVRRRRLTWILVALVPAILVALYSMLFAALATADFNPEDTASWEARLSLENLVSFGDAMVYRLVALFCVILGGSIAANEYAWRTILTTTVWSGERRSLLAGKLAIVGFVGLAFILAGWAAIVASLAVGNAARDTLSTPGAGLAVDLVRAVAITWAAAMVYGVMAVALGFWTRSAAAAITVPVGVLLLEPLGAAGLAALGDLGEIGANLTLSHNIDGLLAANGPIQGAGEDLTGYPPAWRSGFLLAAFVSVTAWLTSRLLERRDISE